MLSQIEHAGLQIGIVASNPSDSAQPPEYMHDGCAIEAFSIFGQEEVTVLCLFSLPRSQILSQYILHVWADWNGARAIEAFATDGDSALY